MRGGMFSFGSVMAVMLVGATAVAQVPTPLPPPPPAEPVFTRPPPPPPRQLPAGRDLPMLPSYLQRDANPASPIARWMEELTDADPAVRESARVGLMGIYFEELGQLRQFVEQNRPLAPAQAAVLHDVVVHSYIAAETYPHVRRGGFLGVMLEPVYDGGNLTPAEIIQQGMLDAPSAGVMIRETWHGFAGFRYLRVGDVVVGVPPASGPLAPRLPGQAEAVPPPPPAGPRLPNVSDLKRAVSDAPPGRPLRLQLLRQGRVIDVDVTISQRPPWALDERTTREEHNNRMNKAEMYWRVTFEPLLENGMS